MVVQIEPFVGDGADPGIVHSYATFSCIGISIGSGDWLVVFSHESKSWSFMAVGFLFAVVVYLSKSDVGWDVESQSNVIFSKSGQTPFSTS